MAHVRSEAGVAPTSRRYRESYSFDAANGSPSQRNAPCALPPGAMCGKSAGNRATAIAAANPFACGWPGELSPDLPLHPEGSNHAQFI
jgi:hypothetical protein